MAKFCKNCGTELKEGKVCQNCGTVNEGATVTTTTTTSSSNNTNSTTTNSGSNGMAIAGFVLSLVGLLCCGFTSVLGLIFSIIGYTNATKNNGNNKGLALAGIIISSIALVLYVILLIISIASGSSFYNYYYKF